MHVSRLENDALSCSLQIAQLSPQTNAIFMYAYICLYTQVYLDLQLITVVLVLPNIFVLAKDKPYDWKTGSVKAILYSYPIKNCILSLSCTYIYWSTFVIWIPSYNKHSSLYPSNSYFVTSCKRSMALVWGLLVLFNSKVCRQFRFGFWRKVGPLSFSDPIIHFHWSSVA